MAATLNVHDPIDVAVEFGLVLPGLPELNHYETVMSNKAALPPQLVHGVLHQGCKMILGGPSKSNKSWCLIDLAMSVAAGQPWWGHTCTRRPALYINFELPSWAVRDRLEALQHARPELTNEKLGKHLCLWNLRGYAADISNLRSHLERQLDKHDFGLIIVDPAYKLLGDRDENANGDITSLMNEFEGLCSRTQAALVLAHHFAKGDSSSKDPIDRMSGAGAWARDPDTLMILTPHEEPNCFTVSSIIRNMPQIDDFVVEWDFPVMKRAADLDPAAIRTKATKRKVCTDREFLEQFLGTKPKSRAAILNEAGSQGVSRATVDRYLKRLSEAGIVTSASGLYWVTKR